MRDGVRDRAFPFEAEVAVARLHRQPRHLGGREARAMQIELGVAEPVAPSRWPPHQLRPKHIAIERVGTLPVGDMDDAVVELDRQCHELPACDATIISDRERYKRDNLTESEKSRCKP